MKQPLLENVPETGRREVFPREIQAEKPEKLQQELELRTTLSANDDSILSDQKPLLTPGAELDQASSSLRSIRRYLGMICIVVVLGMLTYAQAVFIPLALSLVAGLLLRPIVRWMARRHIPEYVGAFLCLTAVVVAIAAGVLPLIGPATQWLNDMPQHMSQARDKLQVLKEQVSGIAKVRTQIAELAVGGEQETQPVPVMVKEPELTSSAVMLSTTGNMIGMWLVVIVLTYFLLTSGDSLINSVLTMLPTFREKRRTVELIKQVEKSVSSYLATITVINFSLGFVIGLVLWLMGVPNPALWGLMTAIFNYVPFLGQGVAGLIIGLVAFLSFDSVGYALLVPVAFYTIAAIEGNVITPALVGKHMSLNPVLVLVSLLVWGWMWGIAGAALAVPLLAILKIGCEHFGMTPPARRAEA